MARGNRSTWRTIGHGIFYAIMGVVLAVMLVVAVGNTFSGVQPTYWGTFTQSGCDYARFGCLPVGTWTSDDGSIVKKKVHLDGGTVGQGGTARAGPYGAIIAQGHRAGMGECALDGESAPTPE